MKRFKARKSTVDGITAMLLEPDEGGAWVRYEEVSRLSCEGAAKDELITALREVLRENGIPVSEEPAPCQIDRFDVRVGKNMYYIIDLENDSKKVAQTDSKVTAVAICNAMNRGEYDFV